MITNFKNNKLLMIGTILSVAYIVYGWFSYANIEEFIEKYADPSDDPALISASIAILSLPHLVVGSVGIILNIVGAADLKRNLIKASAILYAVTVGLWIFWAWALIPGMILMFLALKKIPKETE